MNKKQIIDDITGYIEPILVKGQYELVDIEFVKEGPMYYLRIYVDKEGGITVEDCVTITRELNPILDEKDPIEPAYMLEVSSPGLDRVLKREKDFEKFKGEMVDVKVYEAIDKKKHFIAKLISKENEVITIEDEGVEIKLDMKNVAVIRLAVLF